MSDQRSLFNLETFRRCLERCETDPVSENMVRMMVMDCVCDPEVPLKVLIAAGKAIAEVREKELQDEAKSN